MNAGKDAPASHLFLSSGHVLRLIGVLSIWRNLTSLVRRACIAAWSVGLRRISNATD